MVSARAGWSRSDQSWDRYWYTLQLLYMTENKKSLAIQNAVLWGLIKHGHSADSMQHLILRVYKERVKKAVSVI